MKRILCAVLTLVLAASLVCVPALAVQETVSLKGYWNTGFELLMRFDAYAKELNKSDGGRTDVDIYRVEKGAEVNWATQMMGAMTEGCAVSLTQVRYDHLWGVYKPVPNTRRVFTGSTGSFKLSTEGLWAVGVSDSTSPVTGWDVDMPDAPAVVFSVGTVSADSAGSNEVRLSAYSVYPNGQMSPVTPMTLRFSGAVTVHNEQPSGYVIIDVPMGSTLALPGKDFSLTHVTYSAAGTVVDAASVPVESAATDTSVSFRLVTAGTFRLEGRNDMGYAYNFGYTVYLNVIDTVGAPPVPTLYVVKRGDTLAGIAQAVLGDSSKWQVIFEANKEKISSPGKIVVGMVLLIPPLTEIDGQDAGTGTAPAVTAPEGYRTYVVQKGDSLRKIAANELGDWQKWTLLYEANKSSLPDRNVLKPGQVILIPLDVPLW